MNIIMKDQACKAWLMPKRPLWTEQQERAIDCVRYLPLLTLGAVAVIFMLVTAFDDPAEAANITGATTDNLMSEEMASYTVTQGHAMIFDEGDME